MNTADPKGTAPQAAGSMQTRKLLATLVVALLALGGYYQFVKEKPPGELPQPEGDSSPSPEVEQFRSSMVGIFMTANSLVGRITDETSAESAVPDFERLNAKLDEVQALKSTLPEVVQSQIGANTTEPLTNLKGRVEKALAIPGVADKLQAVLDEFVKKLTAASE